MYGIRLALLLTFALPAAAQSKFEYWPGTTYDASVPTHKQILGYDPGDRIASPAEIVKYLESLAAARPDRLKLREYGRTWENRRLVYAVIGSQANIRRLDEIKEGLAKLADPRKTSDAEAARLTGSLPVIVWLAYGVHGNEISSPDAGLMMAYHLLAARNDKTVETFLSKVVVV
ncbi:MAG TPA: M14 family zinc carboxypeptidase, partial [Bryobacteraceae bacterium]|nr:M14 family zinc carboxypeptidase [Bryobacteraceae bacterium]